jgi:hypothetical protein
MSVDGPGSGRVAPKSTLGPWKRVGVLSALLWAAVGLAAAWVSAQLGAPRLSGWLAMMSGPLALWIVGSRYRLASRGDWTRAGCIGLIVAGAILGVGGAFYAMALYG